MPKRRRFSSRRRRFSSRRGTRKIRRVVKSTIRHMSEIKYSVFRTTFVNTPGTSTLQELTPDFNLGTDKFSRIGDKIKYKFAQVYGSITFYPLTAPPEFVRCRCVIFWARQVPSLSYSNVADISADVWSTLKPNMLRVVKDYRFYLSPNNFNESGFQVAKKIQVRRRANQNVLFRQGGNRVEDPQDRLYVIFTSDGIVTTSEFSCTFISRISFYDT